MPVFPLVNFSDKYFLYLMINMFYYSYSQVAKYVAVGESKVARRERKIMRFIGKLKIMLILMICNDLFFSSARNLLHYNFATYGSSNQALQFFIISLATMVFICYDIISIIVNISKNQVVNLFKENTRFVKMNLSQKPKYLSDLSQGLIHDDGTPKQAKVGTVINLADNQTDESKKPKPEGTIAYQKPLFEENQELNSLRYQVRDLKSRAMAGNSQD